jgi:hypothetical protein
MPPQLTLRPHSPGMPHTPITQACDGRPFPRLITATLCSRRRPIRCPHLRLLPERQWQHRWRNNVKRARNHTRHPYATFITLVRCVATLPAHSPSLVLFLSELFIYPFCNLHFLGLQVGGELQVSTHRRAERQQVSPSPHEHSHARERPVTGALWSVSSMLHVYLTHFLSSTPVLTIVSPHAKARPPPPPPSRPGGAAPRQAAHTNARKFAAPHEMPPETPAATHGEGGEGAGGGRALESLQGGMSESEAFARAMEESLAMYNESVAADKVCASVSSCLNPFSSLTSKSLSVFRE